MIIQARNALKIHFLNSINVFDKNPVFKIVNGEEYLTINGHGYDFS